MQRVASLRGSWPVWRTGQAEEGEEKESTPPTVPSLRRQLSREEQNNLSRAGQALFAALAGGADAVNTTSTTSDDGRTNGPDVAEADEQEASDEQEAAVHNSPMNDHDVLRPVQFASLKPVFFVEEQIDFEFTTPPANLGDQCYVIVAPVQEGLNPILKSALPHQVAYHVHPRVFECYEDYDIPGYSRSWPGLSVEECMEKCQQEGFTGFVQVGPQELNKGRSYSYFKSDSPEGLHKRLL